MLKKYYYSKAEHEDFYLAESIFEHIISSMSYNNSPEQLLAASVTDSSSIYELKRISENNANARNVYENLKEYLKLTDTEQITNNEVTTNIPHEKSIENGINNIHDHLSSFDNLWDARRFLTKWFKNKISNSCDFYDLFNVFKELESSFGLQHMDGELLDIIFPVVYEFDDESAFEILCWAQANDSGWESFWNSIEKSVNRWTILRNYYNERYLEFLDKSIKYSERKFGKVDNYFIKIPRTIEFFNFFGRDDLNIDIIENAINMIESLMANLKLPIIDWYNIEDLDEIDILIQRVTWISPIVKERSINSLAKLLNDNNFKNITFEKILKKLDEESCETIIHYFLLVFLKAKEFGNHQFLNEKKQEIVNVIKKKTLLIKLILEKIFNQHFKKDFLIKSVDDENLELDFQFEKKVKYILPPIYLETIQNIELELGLDLMKVWNLKSQNLISSRVLNTSFREITDYSVSNRRAFMPGASSKLAEIYKSTYLEIIEEIFLSGLISWPDYYLYSYLVLPVDLILWNIKTNSMPNWWPKIEPNLLKDISNLRFTVDGIKLGIEEFLKTRRIIALEGIVDTHKYSETSFPDTKISIIGFLYQNGKLNFSDAEKIYKTINKKIEARNSLITNSQSIYIKVENDELILPLVTRYFPITMPYFQWYRLLNLQFGLNEKIFGEMNLEISENGYLYENDGVIISRHYDWLRNFEERIDYDLPNEYGQYLEFGDLSLNLEVNDLKLGYVVELIEYNKQYSFEEAEENKQYLVIEL